MAKVFTPLIGLAVVVALAMAAVFGAMSLTNPAFAAVDSPASDRLAERTFSPQDALTLKAVGGDGTATLTWTRVASDTHFRVRFRLDSDSFSNADWSKEGIAVKDLSCKDSGFSCEHEVTSLTNGELHVFEVQAGTSKDGPWGARATAEATPSTPPSGTITNVVGETTENPGEIKLTWTWTKTAGPDITGWEYSTSLEQGVWKPMTGIDGAARSYTVTGLIKGDHKISVRAVAGDVPTDNVDESNEVKGVLKAPGEPIFTAGSTKPGKNTQYTIEFTANEAIDTGSEAIVITMEDFGIPSSIDADDIILRIISGPSKLAVGDTGYGKDGDPLADQAPNPLAVSVSGDDLSLIVPDFGDRAEGDQGILNGDTVAVIIYQDAGITNPTGGGDYGVTVVGGDGADITTNEIFVPRIISLSENDGGRGDTIMVTGKGFKSGQGINFWLDRDVDGIRDAGEFLLCSATVGGDDTASCEFEVSNPPFSRGVGGAGQTIGEDSDGDNKCVAPYSDCNFVNAEDGRGNLSDATPAAVGMVDDQTFELKASIKATPEGGSPGQSIQIKLTDYPAGQTVYQVNIGGQAMDGSNFGSIDSMGNSTFSITIPNDVSEGKQDLRVYAGAGSDLVNERTTITIGGPVIRVTPGTMVANQRVSLIGVGFTPNARICCETTLQSGQETVPSISVGGHTIPVIRINDGRAVLVDNGGNWSAAVDLPLVSATTSEGAKPLVVMDSQGRSGHIEVTVPAREVSITPDVGRVGTQAVVRGKNFPSKNDEGDSFSISVIYDAGTNAKTQISAVPDASGNFEVDLRIPTGATIPSTNQVRVEFEDSSGAIVPTTVTHMVPEGAISLNIDSGSPGSAVTVMGEGFKAFVPVRSVMVGSLEVTPAPRPSTDAQGMMNFDVTIPGLDVGIQTIEVKVGDTTASTGFTVTVSGVSPGDITKSAAAVENLGENFVTAFNFNNDTKDWTFYNMAAGDASTLANFITGETYWVRVTETTEVILNGKTRNLTCAGGNCWNQIVW